MDLKGILAISGYPGLYKMISQARNSVIVESLETKKRRPAHATHKISALDDIAIYTDGGELPLKNVLIRMYDHLEGQPAPNHKKASANELKEMFADVLPDYDRDRVYVSDIKRMVNWYNILLEQGMIDLGEEEDEGEGDADKDNPDTLQENQASEPTDDE